MSIVQIHAKQDMQASQWTRGDMGLQNQEHIKQLADK